MNNNFKFGRGITNPCKDLLNDYILADIEFTRLMHESQLDKSLVFTYQLDKLRPSGEYRISTVRPDASANILMGSPSGLIPLMGDRHWVRKVKKSQFKFA